MTTLPQDLPENYKEILSGKKSIKEKPTFIDMFCGCGGLTQGFVDAGYEVLFGVDHDEPSLSSYSKNFGEGKGVKVDLFNPDYLDRLESLVSQSSKKKIDVVVAGPPCQGFSLTGSRNFEDPRNQLYLSVFKVVEKFQPKAFLIENVKGMKFVHKPGERGIEQIIVNPDVVKTEKDIKKALTKRRKFLCYNPTLVTILLALEV
jgi:site-specific DNA-cytosine methylase